MFAAVLANSSADVMHVLLHLEFHLYKTTNKLKLRKSIERKTSGRAKHDFRTQATKSLV